MDLMYLKRNFVKKMLKKYSLVHLFVLFLLPAREIFFLSRR